MGFFFFYFPLFVPMEVFMKKALLIALAVILTGSMTLMAEGPFSKDHGMLNAGLGIGSTLTGDATLPPVTVSYEVGWPADSPDFFKKMSIGGLVGLSLTEYDYFYGTFNYTHIIVGARGSYHFYNKDKFDAYGGVMLGYNIISSSYESKSGYDDYDYAAASSGITYSAFLGARYFFTDKFGAFAELGYGIAYLNFGLTMKM